MRVLHIVLAGSSVAYLALASAILSLRTDLSLSSLARAPTNSWSLTSS
jgi:hypothetical protein